MSTSSIARPPDDNIPQILDKCPNEFSEVFLASCWTFERKFDNIMAAVSYLENDQIKCERVWKLDERICFTTEIGYKQTYRCTVSPTICPAAKCLFYPLNSTDVLVFRSNIGHQHEDSLPLDSQFITKIDHFTIDKMKEWDIEGSFSSLSDVTEYLNNLKTWSLISKYEKPQGTRFHYRCNLVPENGPQCAAKMYFFYKAKSAQILLYHRNLGHTHDSILSNNSVLQPTPGCSLKRKSDVLIESLTKENQAILKTRGFKMMCGVQLKDCLKEKMIDKPNITQPIDAQNNEICVFENSTKYSIKFVDKVANTADMIDNVALQPKLRKTPIKSKNIWAFERLFDNIKIADSYLTTLKIWSKFTRSNTAQGLKQYYFCAGCNKDGHRCSAKIYLFHPLAKNGEVLLYRNQHSHSHSDYILPNSQPISKPPDTCKNNELQLSINVKLPIINITENDPSATKDAIEGEIINNITGTDVSTEIGFSFDRSFDNVKIAEIYLLKCGIWSESTCYTVDTGFKQHYYCNFYKNGELKCPAKIYLFHSIMKNYKVIHLFRHRSQHSHPEVLVEMPTIGQFMKDKQTPKDSFSRIDIEKEITMNILDKESSSLNEIHEITNLPKIKVVYNWTLEKSFENKKTAETYLGSMWAKIAKNTTTTGTKQYYCCSKKLSSTCQAKMHLLYPADEHGEFRLYRNEMPHTHTIVPISLPSIQKIKRSHDSEITIYIWTLERSFDNIKMAETYLGNMWAKTARNNTTVGFKQYYCCSKRFGPSCQAKIYLLHSVDEPRQIHLYRNDRPHLHTSAPISSLSNNEKNEESQHSIIVEMPISNWKLERSFDSIITAELYVGKMWAKVAKNNTIAGLKQYYCCSKKIGPTCEAKIYLLHSVEKPGEVHLYRNDKPHSHSNVSALVYNNQKNGESQDSSIAEIPIVDLSEEDLPPAIKDSYENTPIKWIFLGSFENFEMAETYVSSFKIWTKFTNSITYEGFKQYYHCSRKLGTTCPARIYLFRPSGAEEVLLYENNISHSHSTNNQSTNNLASSSQIIIDLSDTIMAEMPIIDLCEDIERDMDSQETIVAEIPIVDLSDDYQENIESQDAIISEIPVVDLSEDDRTATSVSDNGNETVIVDNNIDLMLTNKFKNLEMAKIYLKNISMSYMHSQKQPHTNFEFYTCDSDALEPCLVTEYTNEMSETRLYKNTKGIHTYFSLVSNLDHTTTIENLLQVEAFIPAAGEDDKPFITNFAVDYKKHTFQCFITTRRLLSTARESRILITDHKCTLNWRTYSILVLGTTDMNQKFHSFGICITPSKLEHDYEFAFRALNNGILECFNYEYKPEIIVCNSESIIQNAFMIVYENPRAKIIICHEFMVSEIASKLKLTVKSETIRDDIIEDIEKIQKLCTSEMFFEAITLFCREWSTQTVFLKYFKTVWFHKNCNWYSGFTHYAPSTVAALVAEYERIENESISQLFCTFSSLKSFVFNIVESWSMDYMNQTKIFAHLPTIDITLYEESCHWSSMQTQIEIQEINGTTCYYVPNENAIRKPNQWEKYKSKDHLNLLDFFNDKFSFWELKQIMDTDIICSCPQFFKHYVCKHSLGITSAVASYLNTTEILGDCDAIIATKEEIL